MNPNINQAHLSNWVHDPSITYDTIL